MALQTIGNWKIHGEDGKGNELGSRIARKLRLGRKLTSYEERYLETWIYEYGFDRISLTWRWKRPRKDQPHFRYIHGVLKGWFNDGLRTKDQILAASQAAASKSGKKAAETASRRSAFTQRSYDDAFFDMLDNVSVKGKDRGNGPD